MAEIDDFNADLNYEAEVGDGTGDNEEADGGEAEMMVHEYYFPLFIRIIKGLITRHCLLLTFNLISLFMPNC